MQNHKAYTDIGERGRERGLVEYYVQKQIKEHLAFKEILTYNMSLALEPKVIFCHISVGTSPFK